MAACNINPLVPDAHYSERQDAPFSLQIQQLWVDLKWNYFLRIFIGEFIFIHGD